MGRYSTSQLIAVGVHPATGLRVHIIEHRLYESIYRGDTYMSLEHERCLIQMRLTTEAGQQVIPDIEGDTWVTCRVVSTTGEMIQLLREEPGC